MGVLPVTELAIHPISILITGPNGTECWLYFCWLQREVFLGFGSGVEWYVSALTRAVQTRKGSDGGYYSDRGSVTLW